MRFQEITILLDNAFFQIESFMNGTKKEYTYFGFNDIFTMWFNEAKKTENFTFDNCKLIGQYYDLTSQISVDYDKSDFENADAYENEAFCKDCEEIMVLNWERSEEWCAFLTPDEIEESERKFSITDILKRKNQPTQQTATSTHKPPEPQTISTALFSQTFISRIFRDQIKWRATIPKDFKGIGHIEDCIKRQTKFYHIVVDAPFEITDFVSFHKSIIEKGTNAPEIRDTMKRIYKVAVENMNYFKIVQAITDSTEICYYKLDKQNNVSIPLRGTILTEAENNPYQQVLTNDELFDYCDAVADFMRSCIAPGHQAKERKYAEKWYALYHVILIAIGKQVPRLSSGCKAEIIKYGNEQYSTGQGFYRELIKIDLNNMTAFVRSLPAKDKKQWKQIIKDLSDNDADVISWLHKQPN